MSKATILIVEDSPIFPKSWPTPSDSPTSPFCRPTPPSRRSSSPPNANQA